jgi:cytochrome b561
MAFNIDIKDGIATMGGQASLKRTPLNLGLSSDPNAEWVSEDIAVTVTGSATRTGP